MPEVATGEGPDEASKFSTRPEGKGSETSSSAANGSDCWASQWWSSLRCRMPTIRGEFPIGLVCVDEVHFIGDPQRGHLLEMLLAKLLFLNQLFRRPIQLIGMSATLPNARQVRNVRQSAVLLQSVILRASELARKRGERIQPLIHVSLTYWPGYLLFLRFGVRCCCVQIAKWLDAELFVTDLRPSPLDVFVKVGSEVRCLHAAAIVAEALPHGVTTVTVQL